MNDQRPASSPRQEANPIQPPRPTSGYRSFYPPKLKRRLTDSFIESSRKRKPCQAVQLSFKRLRKSYNTVAYRTPSHTPITDRETTPSSSLALPASIQVETAASSSTHIEEELSLDDDTTAWSTAGVSSSPYTTALHSVSSPIAPSFEHERSSWATLASSSSTYINSAVSHWTSFLVAQPSNHEGPTWSTPGTSSSSHSEATSISSCSSDDGSAVDAAPPLTTSTPLSSPSTSDRDDREQPSPIDTGSIHTELGGPHRDTTFLSEYSVTRERPRHFIEAFLDAMPADRNQPLKPTRHLPYTKSTIHDHFDNIVDVAASKNAHATSSDQENRDPGDPDRTQKKSGDFHLLRKGRFAQQPVDMRRRILASRAGGELRKDPKTLQALKDLEARRKEKGLESPIVHVSEKDEIRGSAGPSRSTLDGEPAHEQHRVVDPINLRSNPPHESGASDSATPAGDVMIAPEEPHYSIVHDNSDFKPGWTLYEVPITPPRGHDLIKKIDITRFFSDSRERHDLIDGTLIPVTKRGVWHSEQLAELGLTISKVGCGQSFERMSEGRAAFGSLEQASELYYHALDVEFRTGCRCGQYIKKRSMKITREVYELKPTSKVKKVCVCGRWRREIDTRIPLNAATFLENTSRYPYPSRVLPMFQDLRNLVQILMERGRKPPPTLKPFEPVVDTREIRLARLRLPFMVDAKSVYRPEPRPAPPEFHSLEQLLEELDPIFLAGQIRDGRSDLDIFRKLAKTIKSYCQPSRYAAADEIVNYADNRDITNCVRACYNVLWLMQIDRQNHRLETQYRPWLKDTAIYHELASFERALEFEGKLLEDSDTQVWISAASQNVLDKWSSDQQFHLHLLGQCSCNNQSELLVRSVVDGVFSLIFADWYPDFWASPARPPTDRCRWKATGPIAPWDNTHTPWLHVPESMRMDTNRLNGLSKELGEYARQVAVLGFARQCVRGHQPDLTDAELEVQVGKCHFVLNTCCALDPEYMWTMKAEAGMVSSWRYALVHKVVTDEDEEPTPFLLWLASFFIFRHGLPFDTTLPGTAACTEEEMTQVMDSAKAIRNWIEHALKQRLTEDHDLSRSCLRELLTLKIENELVRSRLDVLRPLFAPVGMDCQLATRALLSEPDIYHGALERDRFASVLLPNYDRHISEDHVRRWSKAWEYQNKKDHLKLSKSMQFKFTLLLPQLDLVAEEMCHWLQRHLAVYWKIYSGKGMLENSGELTLFEKQQLRGKRKAENLANTALTHISTAPPSPTPDPDSGGGNETRREVDRFFGR